MLYRYSIRQWGLNKGPLGIKQSHYAYITKLVKICDQLLGHVGCSNCPSPSRQYGTLFHILSQYMENLCREISTLHINAISISLANIILHHLPPESIATLWYYHISFIMVQPHCCMACLILGRDILRFF